MMRKGIKVRLPAEAQVEIVNDAALANPSADGRLIAVLILDTTTHPQLEELIRIHGDLGSGDVRSRWGTVKGMKKAMLHLEFSRPLELETVLIFDIEKYAGVVELMLTAKAVYLQAGAPGDRLASTVDSPRLLVELPETGFREQWDRLLLKRITSVMKEEGLSRDQAKSAAQSFIKQMREFAGFHLK